MAKFEIYSYEINTKETVTAQGIAEAMLEYLPWPSIDISIKWSPCNGQVCVVDNSTDFKYDVALL